MRNAAALQRHANHDARLIDQLTDSFAKELSTVVDLLTAKIRVLVRKLDRNTDGRVVATRQNLAMALRLRADLVQALDDAGYTALALRANDAPLDRLASQMLKAGTKAGDAARLTAFDIDALAALKELRLADLLQVGEDAAITLWRVVVDGTLGTRPVLDLVDDVADLLDISARRARTVYDTAVSTFSRQVAQLGTTGEADEAFFYVGPVDQKIRPFCLEHVGKVYSRTSIDAMDNGQLPQVLITCGGFQCRHMWARVSPLDKELLALMDTDVRSDAVQIRVDDSDLEEAA
jgi:hypothetical protein